MENKDFIVEQILSIEDFNNVDSNLLKIISENDEYRKIFEEYKELSTLVAECALEPVKDGVTLCDAVMARVQKGDIAPRYINTNKFRFPVATVASLIAVVAVVLVSRIGLPFNKADNAIEDSAIFESQNTGGVNYANNASFNVAVTDDGKSEIAILSDSYDCEVNDEEAPETVASYFKSASENGAVSKSDAGLTTQNVAAETDDSIMYKPYNAKDYSVSAGGGVEILNGKSGQIAEEEVETESIKERLVADSSVGDEILERLEYAKRSGVQEERLIGIEQITELGEQNFIDWFDSIKDRADFAEIYSYSAFCEFCSNKN